MKKRRLKMMIEFDLEPEDNGYAHMIKYLMIDAVAEFHNNRDPAGEYVARRYAAMLDSHGAGWMAAKKKQVEGRLEAAKAIRHGIHDNLKIEEVSDA